MEHKPTSIGLKIGSSRTVFAVRTDSGIETKHNMTCIRYPYDALHNKQLPPIIGNEAASYADAIYPFHLGVIEGEAGIAQAKDILASFNIPKGANMVVAAPAVQIKDGRDRLINVINDVFNPKSAMLFPEGMCSAAQILGDPKILFNSTFFCLNLGSSTTEFVCISEGKTAHMRAHSEISGNKVDNAILNRICGSVGDAMISITEAREIKEAQSLTNPKEFTVKGMTRDGIAETHVLGESIIPLQEYIKEVAEITKKEIIGSVSAEVRRLAFRPSKDLGKPMPLVISGGMSNIEGLPESLVKTISEKMNHSFELSTAKDKQGHIAPAVGALMLCEAIAEEQKGAQT